MKDKLKILKDCVTSGKLSEVYVNNVWEVGHSKYSFLCDIGYRIKFVDMRIGAYIKHPFDNSSSYLIRFEDIDFKKTLGKYYEEENVMKLGKFNISELNTRYVVKLKDVGNCFISNKLYEATHQALVLFRSQDLGDSYGWIKLEEAIDNNRIVAIKEYNNTSQAIHAVINNVKINWDWEFNSDQKEIDELKKEISSMETSLDNIKKKVEKLEKK